MANDSKYVPLKRLLPEDMSAKTARSHLRGQDKFRPHDGRWEFPRKTADKVERMLIQHVTE